MKEKLDLMCQIADRAQELGAEHNDRITFMLDMECADKAFNMDWKGLLMADDFNFVHDVCGIQNHVDRKNKQMSNRFLPRFAK